MTAPAVTIRHARRAFELLLMGAAREIELSGRPEAARESALADLAKAARGAIDAVGLGDYLDPPEA